MAKDKTTANGINKVILVGTLGHEPQVRIISSGDMIATASIATSTSWKDKNTGELLERTEWHRVVFIGKVAEIAKQHLHKGQKIFLEGKLHTRKWQNKNGQDRYTTEVLVNNSNAMQTLDEHECDQP